MFDIMAMANDLTHNLVLHEQGYTNVNHSKIMLKSTMYSQQKGKPIMTMRLAHRKYKMLCRGYLRTCSRQISINNNLNDIASMIEKMLLTHLSFSLSYYSYWSGSNCSKMLIFDLNDRFKSIQYVKSSNPNVILSNTTLMSVIFLRRTWARDLCNIRFGVIAVPRNNYNNNNSNNKVTTLDKNDNDNINDHDSQSFLIKLLQSRNSQFDHVRDKVRRAGEGGKNILKYLSPYGNLSVRLKHFGDSIKTDNSQTLPPPTTTDYDHNTKIICNIDDIHFLRVFENCRGFSKNHHNYLLKLICNEMKILSQHMADYLQNSYCIQYELHENIYGMNYYWNWTAEKKISIEKTSKHKRNFAERVNNYITPSWKSACNLITFDGKSFIQFVYNCDECEKESIRIVLNYGDNQKIQMGQDILLQPSKFDYYIFFQSVIRRSRYKGKVRRYGFKFREKRTDKKFIDSTNSSSITMNC